MVFSLAFVLEKVGFAFVLSWEFVSNSFALVLATLCLEILQLDICWFGDLRLTVIEALSPVRLSS